MEPCIDEPDFRLYLGEACTTLALLPDASVDCIITSPPYWALRDYGTAEWEGGDPACDHKQGRAGAGRADGLVDERSQRNRDGTAALTRADCAKCGALRVDQQLGLEPVHDCAGWATGAPCGACYVCKLVAVLRECRRVLAPHGTLWLNLGDSYNSQPSWGRGGGSTLGGRKQGDEGHPVAWQPARGLKTKDLVGIPWRVALALQADGWWLRNDNIWSKGNPMPDSVTDRANVSHEYVFMLARNDRPLYWTHDVTGAWADGKPAADYWWFPPPELAHLEPDRLEPYVKNDEAPWRRRNAWRGHAYWYDGEAVKEPAAARQAAGMGRPATGNGLATHYTVPAGRTGRTVWEINTEPYPRAHFAVFPQRLVRRALRAGCPREVCTVCGLPRERIVKKGKPVLQAETWTANGAAAYDEDAGGYVGAGGGSTLKHVVPTTTVGWTDCGHGSYRPGIVLDPFLGSGTVVAVARQELRHTIGIELNPAYVPFIVERAAAWRTGRPAPAPAVNDDQMTLAVE